ncbi:phage major capsid protein, partial [Escherichia sp. HC-CC]
VAESSGSDKQKKTTGSITFNYHKLLCAVAVSLEVETMSLAVFETTLINNIVEAMTKAIEQAIVSGDGSGKPKGILAET